MNVFMGEVSFHLYCIVTYILLGREGVWPRLSKPGRQENTGEVVGEVVGNGEFSRKHAVMLEKARPRCSSEMCGIRYSVQSAASLEHLHQKELLK